jgi:hypothetical protein
MQGVSLFKEDHRLQGSSHGSFTFDADGSEALPRKPCGYPLVSSTSFNVCMYIYIRCSNSLQYEITSFMRETGNMMGFNAGCNPEFNGIYPLTVSYGSHGPWPVP